MSLKSPRLLTETAAAPFAEPIEAALSTREWRSRGLRHLQVFLVLSRRAILLDGPTRIELPAPSLAWLPGGQDRTLELEAGASGHVMTVRTDRMLAALSGLSGAARMKLLIACPFIILPARMTGHVAEVAHSFQVLAREGREPDEHSNAVAASHLALLCLHVSRLAEVGVGAARPPPEMAASVAQRFLGLVELHLCDGWSVRHYADALGVTPDRLHAASTRGFGKAPGRLLKERIAAETRSRLEGSDLSAEQIAFSLGFRDPSYFNRFCRKHLGSAPGRFRRTSRSARREDTQTSFAAWP